MCYELPNFNVGHFDISATVLRPEGTKEDINLLVRINEDGSTELIEETKHVSSEIS